MTVSSRVLVLGELSCEGEDTKLYLEKGRGGRELIGEVLGWREGDRMGGGGKEGWLGQDNGELTSVLQDRCLRLSPRQYLPPMVGLEGAGDSGER